MVKTISGCQQTQVYTLTQAEFHALVHGFEVAMKFDPTTIVVMNSVLIADVAGGRGWLHADFSGLIKPSVSMAVMADRSAIKRMGLIRGEGDVHLILQDERYHVRGDHTGAYLQAQPKLPLVSFALPIINWLGVEVSGYAPKDLKAYIGRKKDAAQLAVYDFQIEQLGVEGQGYPYTFTSGMATQLANREPNAVFLSRLAFSHFGKKQSIHLGQAPGQYILKVNNSLDIGVDLEVFELLEVVPGVVSQN